MHSIGARFLLHFRPAGVPPASFRKKQAGRLRYERCNTLKFTLHSNLIITLIGAIHALFPSETNHRMMS